MEGITFSSVPIPVPLSTGTNEMMLLPPAMAEDNELHAKCGVCGNITRDRVFPKHWDLHSNRFRYPFNLKFNERSIYEFLYDGHPYWTPSGNAPT